MEWNKLEINTTSYGTDIITSMLVDLGVNGTEVIDHAERQRDLNNSAQYWDYIEENLLECTEGASVIAYLGTDEESENLAACIISQLESIRDNAQHDMGSLSATITKVNDDDWLHEWKKHFHPFTIGRVKIVPVWEEATSTNNEVVFTIDPGSAFGTGQHETTMLCIKALQERVTPSSTILDIGCGSGILSIVSLLLGAATATACDIDPSAVAVTKKNGQLNHINESQLSVHVGDIITDSALQNTIKKQGYSIVLANIVADVIIKLAPYAKSCIAPEGIMIASGIITERLEEVVNSLKTSGLKIIDTKEQGGWCCVVASNG